MTSLTVIAMMTACSSLGSSGSQPSGSTAVSTNLTTKPVTLHITMSVGNEAQYVQQTSAMFTKLHPNIKFDITTQQFTSLVQNAQHLVTGSNIPDMIQLANFGSLVKDKLLTNLDPYAKVYGWDKWDSGVFDGLRMSHNGTQLGSGSLYGIGHGSNITSVYYNKGIASKLGIESTPTTLNDFVEDMQKAKAANIVPLVVNGQDGLLTYPLQNLAVAFEGSVAATQNWIYQKSGATIVNDYWVKAATTLQQWANAGYLSPNTVSLNQTDAVNQFTDGQGLFYLTGDWSAPTFDASKTQTFGTFGFPPADKGGLIAAMTAQNIFSIPSGAAHPNEMAAYLNFILTNAKARQLTYDLTGTVPPVVPGAPTLSIDQNTAQAQAVKVYQQASKEGGLMGFMANATQAMSTTLFPNTQLLVSNKLTPQQFVDQVQSDYESGLTK